MIKIIDKNKILIEWAYRTRDGLPDPKSMSHQIILEGILREFGWNIEQRGELLKNLQEAPETKPDPEKEKLMKKVIKYKDEKGDDAEITVGGAIKQGEDHPAYQKAKQMIGDEDGKEKPKDGDITAEPDAFDRFADEPKDEPSGEEPAEEPAAEKPTLTKLVTKKDKKKEKEKSEKIKGGDPVEATDGWSRKQEQARENYKKAKAAFAKYKKWDEKKCDADKTCRGKKKEYDNAKYQMEQMDKIATLLEKKPPPQDKGETDADYAERVRQHNEAVGEEIQGLIDQSLKRVRGEGGTISKAEPGGIAASMGESSCCAAANKLSKNYDQNRVGSTTDHNGEEIPEDQAADDTHEGPPYSQQQSFDNETHSRRTACAIELGLVELSEEPEDNPPGYKPSQQHIDKAKVLMDKACPVPRPEGSDTEECIKAKENYQEAKADWESKQKEIGLELEKRRRWVDEEYDKIMGADPGSEISEDIKDAEKKEKEKCDKIDEDGLVTIRGKKKKATSAQKKACTAAKKSVRDKKKNLREWLETGYDTGRAMIRDVVHDRDENGEPGEYNAPVGFPNDPVNEEHGTPDSAIMSPEMQALFRGQLENKHTEAVDGYKKCLNTPEEKREPTFTKDCNTEKAKVDHYEDQLKNFDEGVSDHDTGMMYYDADGYLRFVNVSNKKTKDAGKGETKDDDGQIIDEDRNDVTGGIDAQANSTPKAKAEAALAAYDEMIAEHEKAEKEGREPEFPGFTGELGRQVTSALVKGYDKAYELATNAKHKVTTLELDAGPPPEFSQMSGTVASGSSSVPSPDAEIMANKLPELLPPKKKGGRKYVDSVKDHKDTKAKCKELFKHDEPYSDAEVIAAAIELMKDPNNDLPYDPFGKMIEKYGEIYNDMAEKRGGSPPWSVKKIADKYGLTEAEVQAILDSQAMKDCGKLKARRQAAQTEAHKAIIEATTKQDEAWFETDAGKDWLAKNPGPPRPNGPYTQTYVRQFMNTLHWDKQIMNLDGKKQLQIGGVNCKPQDLRDCLAELSGFSDPNSDPPLNPEPEDEPEKTKWRADLLEHLERQIEIDADTGAVRIKGAGGEIGYDTWRTAGNSPKSASGSGKDLRKCLRKKNNTREVGRRKREAEAETK